MQVPCMGVIQSEVTHLHFCSLHLTKPIPLLNIDINVFGKISGFNWFQGDCDDVDGDDGERDETDCVLRDFQYKLTCKFMERERNLKAGGLTYIPFNISHDSLTLEVSSLAGI